MKHVNVDLCQVGSQVGYKIVVYLSGLCRAASLPVVE